MFLNRDEGNILNTYVVLKIILIKDHLRIGNGHPDEETLKAHVSIIFNILKNKSQVDRYALPSFFQYQRKCS